MKPILQIFLITVFLLTNNNLIAQDKNNQISLEKQVPVKGRDPWTHTGIQLTAGEHFKISAKGSINWFTNRCFLCRASPNGASCPGHTAHPFIAPQLKCYSLIGKIGENGEPFQIGKNFMGNANGTGELQVGVNDEWFVDNSGEWTATIQVAPSPKAPDVANLNLVKATTLDANSVSVDYTVNDENMQQIHFDVYRSETPILNDLGAYATNTYTKIGDTDITEENKLIKGLHNNITVISGKPLLPDTRMPYVIVVSTCNNKSDTVYFKKWMLGAISHGFDRYAMDSWVNTIFICHDYSLPAWETTMANDLQKIDGYDSVILFDWMHTCALKQPELSTKAGEKLASQITAYVRSHKSQHQGDVIDIHLIGHSRGTVVISVAALKLSAFNFDNTDPNIKFHPFGGGYVEMTFLDPHPANTDYYPQDNFASWASNDFNTSDCFLDETTSTCVNKYKKEVANANTDELKSILESETSQCFSNTNADYCSAFAESLCWTFPETAVDFAKNSTNDFQASVKDPNIAVPENTKFVDIWYQHTLAKNLCHQPNQEFIQNLWGYVDNNTLKKMNSGIQQAQTDLTNIEIAGIGVIGHNEVPLVYEQLIVKTGTLNRSN